MNDSFLEDLELVSTDVKNVNAYPVDRHVTTRNATSSPLQCLPQNKGEHGKSIEKQSTIKELHAKDFKKLSDQDVRKQQMKVRISDRKEKPIESKLKPIENKVKNDLKEQEVKDDVRVKIRESRVKISENKMVMKDRARRSGSCKENNQTPDLSVKENSRPGDCSKEGTSQVEAGKEKTKSHDTLRKVESKEADSVALLNAIKDIVSICTKQESTKILRAMQELHFNSQANLIKHLLSQTDDIINEMHPSKDSSRVRSLMEQNERLQEDVVILQKRNEELQKKLEEFEFLKQENVTLKLKCKELSKQ
ncbi:hypothetical protein WH47_08779 [Habropoda laboriosa]|uniref:Uncharacterized protein n=1 Tax=Habropoda laboriosa TaxID=597456 RepID=A0A0L7R6K9_9HYME|nr:PREDICTED: uncharacterized protein LOC108571414 [Habropoda laboriosa]KOC66386.1 hypothetical protein WH47_08779 [Habropoda laboriosa]